MGQALVFGAVASAALIAGAALGSLWKPPDLVTAVAIAFAGGALVAALAFELFAEADRLGGVWYGAGGMIAGATVFIVVDARLVSGMRGSQVAWPLLAAAVFDGVPENLALGVTLIDDASVALLVAIVANNLPEALGSAAAMREDGRSPAYILGLWSAAGLLLAGSVIAGRFALADASGSLLAVLLGFAAGAILAALATTFFPEAFKEGGPYVAFASVAGFLLSYVLSGTQ